jgi:DNA-directed RNA polymerase subunit beta'
MREMSASAQPPKKPATSPIGTPSISEIDTETTPASSEARVPKTEAVLADVDGQVQSINKDGGKTTKILVYGNDKETHEYSVPSNITLKVKEGDLIAVGSVLCDGHIDLRKLYEVMGREAVHRYIIREIEEIYASQGEGINDKHIEVIIRQMMSRLRIVDPGDSMLLPGDVVERDQFEEANDEMREKASKEATAESLVLGITKVALSTESFLSAASFMETARVLINAAVQGKEDRLRGLKENVIIGRLIPAGTGYRNSDTQV